MKSFRLIMCALVSASVCFGAAAPRPLGSAVLVVPARYSVLQIAFDVSDRMGAALIAYQGEPKSGTPVLDYWAGQEWKRISQTEYEQASFVGGRVARFVIVGNDEILPAVLVSSVSAWCGDVRVISALDTPGLVNGLGKAFDFSQSDWEWFARRYNLQLADRNAERRTQSWYDRDNYDDEWAHRWQWLRRKYNSAGEPAAFDAAPVNTPPPSFNEAMPAQARSPEPSTSTPEETTSLQSAEDEPTGEIERLDVPLTEPVVTGDEDESAVVTNAVEAEEPQESVPAAEPEETGTAEQEEPWPVK